MTPDSAGKASLDTRGRQNCEKIEAQDRSCGVPVSMSSPRSMSRAGLTAPLGPISASATFSMRSRLACMKLNKLFHSDFWMPLNWYSCKATQETVGLLSVIMQQLALFHSPTTWSRLVGNKIGHVLHCCLTCARTVWLSAVSALCNSR